MSNNLKIGSIVKLLTTCEIGEIIGITPSRIKVKVDNEIGSRIIGIDEKFVELVDESANYIDDDWC